MFKTLYEAIFFRSKIILDVDDYYRKTTRYTNGIYCDLIINLKLDYNDLVINLTND